MEGLNKVIALIVGLFVVLLIIGFFLGRFKSVAPKTASNNSSQEVTITVAPTPGPENQSNGGILNRIFHFNTKPSPTPTPTVEPIVVDTKNVQVIEHVVENKDGSILVTKETSSPKTIPATGAETLPLIASSLLSGIVILKKTRLS